MNRLWVSVNKRVLKQGRPALLRLSGFLRRLLLDQLDLLLDSLLFNLLLVSVASTGKQESSSLLGLLSISLDIVLDGRFEAVILAGDLGKQVSLLHAHIEVAGDLLHLLLAGKDSFLFELLGELSGISSFLLLGGNRLPR